MFTTYERSFITGVDDAINRGYDSHERFLQPDPAGMEAVRLTEPQSLNPYAYVGNDPVNRSDPAGLNDTSDVISAVTGLGSSVLGFIPGFALSGGALGTFSAGVTLGAMSGPFTFYIAPPRYNPNTPNAGTPDIGQSSPDVPDTGIPSAGTPAVDCGSGAIPPGSMTAAGPAAGTQSTGTTRRGRAGHRCRQQHDFSTGGNSSNTDNPSAGALDSGYSEGGGPCSNKKGCPEDQ